MKLHAPVRHSLNKYENSVSYKVLWTKSKNRIDAEIKIKNIRCTETSELGIWSVWDGNFLGNFPNNVGSEAFFGNEIMDADNNSLCIQPKNIYVRTFQTFSRPTFSKMLNDSC